MWQKNVKRFHTSVWVLIALAGCSEPPPVQIKEEVIRPARILTVGSNNNMQMFTFPARVEALQSIDLSFEVAGPLAQLPIREGETVPAGALVAALDPADFRLAVREAEVQRKLAAQDLERKRRVFAEKAIAKSQVDDAQTQYELQSVRLAQARERLEDAMLVAPFEAYVARRYVDRFVNVTPGQPILRLFDLTRLQVVINAPESLVATVDQSRIASAVVEFGFAPGERFELEFHENRGEAGALAQTYEASFLMDSDERFNLLPGMTGQVTISMPTEGQVVAVVPISALVATASNTQSVWVYNPDTQVVTARAVQTGEPDETGVPVLSGLSAGEQIVVTGADQLQPGMRVRPL